MSDADALSIFRDLTPGEFKGLCMARDLPNNGIHEGSQRAPGYSPPAVIGMLYNRGLIQPHPVKRECWQLSTMGKRLMGIEGD